MRVTILKTQVMTKITFQKSVADLGEIFCYLIQVFGHDLILQFSVQTVIPINKLAIFVLL